MRNLFFTIATCLFCVLSFANPSYGPPQFSLNKLFFDNNQKWVIVINIDDSAGKLDSVMICSSTDKSICHKYAIDTFNLKFGVINDSLKSKVNINPEGDSVTLIYYCYKTSITETIVFGNYRNSIIPKPLKGQSIVSFLTFYKTSPVVFYHCISDSTGHTQGTIHGHIYDKNNQLITKDTIAISPFDINCVCHDCIGGGPTQSADVIFINGDGTYSAKLYSLIYNLGFIRNCVYSSCVCGGYYYYVKSNASITPLKLIIAPDTSINVDIHLTSDFVGVGIENVSSDLNEPLKIFPNPINDISFNYEISTPVKSTNCFINLINLEGQRIAQYCITDNSGELILPGNISNGTYLIQLQMNDKIYTSIKLIVAMK